ncbi:MAG: NADH-quinone oxidoreductase subunit C, partial [Gammaproteobacteria bacterium]|nr:NADH-quinone oxidoreductase subunit C [Gammaproteobacteria bacterium]
MTNKVQQLSEKLTQVFSSKLKRNTVDCGEVTIEVAVDDLLTVCLKLRDDSTLAFEQLIDVCGVDYSEYGQTEWATEEATGTGFSRGVDVATHGRLRFGDEPTEKKK